MFSMEKNKTHVALIKHYVNLLQTVLINNNNWENKDLEMLWRIYK